MHVDFRRLVYQVLWVTLAIFECLNSGGSVKFSFVDPSRV